MELKELLAMDDTQLTTLVREQREALRDLRFRIAQKQVKNVREFRARRATVARALTLLRQRRKRIAAVATPPPAAAPSGQ